MLVVGGGISSNRHDPADGSVFTRSKGTLPCEQLKFLLRLMQESGSNQGAGKGPDLSNGDSCR